MEWSRIKNILIIGLALINIMFIGLILMSHHSTETNPGLLQDTVAVLEKNDITFSEYLTLPDPDDSMSVLTLTYNESNGTYSVPISGEINEADFNGEAAVKAADRIFSGLEIETDSTHVMGFDSAVKSDGENSYVITYKTFYKKTEIEDSYVSIKISSDGSAAVTENLAQAAVSARSGLHAVPITSVLLQYMHEVKMEDPSSAKNITDITMVYKIDSPYEGHAATDTAFPVWKITASDGTSKFISAYSTKQEG